MKKLYTLIICFTLLGATAMGVSLQKHGSGLFIEYSSAQEAQVNDLYPFSKTPKRIQDNAITMIRHSRLKDLWEADYGDGEVVLRKGNPNIEDVSNDISDYSMKTFQTVKDQLVLLKGYEEDSLFHLAIWKTKTGSFSLYSEQGMSCKEVKDVIGPML